MFHNNVKLLPNVTLGYSIDECDAYSTDPGLVPYPLPNNPNQLIGILNHFAFLYIQVFPCSNHHTMSIDDFKNTITSRDKIHCLMVTHRWCHWRCIHDIWDAGYNPYSGKPLYSPRRYSPRGTLVDKPETPEYYSDSDGEDQ